MPDTIRWGILGTGNIAHQFARGLRTAEAAELVAVGSRAQETADAFGNEFGVPRRYATYEALAADPDVDAIYVSTPHPFHKDNTILCLNGGKAVLCEKPFAINAAEAEEMIALARQKRLFLMEAMWTRFSPVMGRIRELVGQGVIGDVRLIQADFGYRATFNPSSRAFDPALGGGALLDVGIYPLSLASMLLGDPVSIASQVVLSETGVDEQNGLVLQYADGQIAVLSSALRTNTPQEAVIMGTDGMIRVPSQWWKPQRFILSVGGKADEVVDLPFKGNGYDYEAEEVGRCIRAGERESAIMPLDETLSLMRTMDKLRADWKMFYPTENA